MASFAWFFLLVGVILVLLGLADRWLSIIFYEMVDETGWYFWNGGLPYINSSDGAQEFFTYRSWIFMFLGAVHFGIGGIFFFLPDLWLLLLAWGLLIFIVALGLRYHLIEIAMEIKRKYERPDASDDSRA